MSLGRKILIVGAALALVTVLGWAVLIGTAYALGGVLTVELHDRHEGLDLYLPVPMAALDLAAAAAGLGVERHGVHLAGLGAGFGSLAVDGAHLGGVGGLEELGEIGAVVAELLTVLDDVPDVTLVEVVDGRDHVTVSKRGGDLIVEVDEPDLSVRVSIPTRGARRLAARILG